MKKGLSKSSKKMMLFIILGIVLILGIAVVVNALRPREEVLPKVGAVTVENGEVKEQLDVTGTVRSLETKMFFSPVNAEIKEMDFEVGDIVTKGSKMIAFDIEDLESNNEKAELNVRSSELDYQDAVGQDNKNASKQSTAQANANKLQGAVSHWEGYVKSLKDAINRANKDAQTNATKAAQNAAAAAAEEYKRAEAAYKIELEEVKRVFEEEKAAYATAVEEYKEVERKRVAGTATEAESKTASIAMDQAETNKIYAEDNYYAMLNNPPTMDTEYNADSTAVADTYNLQSELEYASGYLAELKGDLASEKAAAKADVGGLSKETKEKMQIGTNLAELEAKSIEELIKEGKKGVQAEFTGVVSDVRVEKGALVSQGMELFTLHSIDKLSVDVKISKYDYAKVEEGQKATVTMANNEYQGTVMKIDHIALPDAQGNTNIEATIKIDNPDNNVFIGVEAKVVIQAAEAKDVPIVPSEVINIGKEGSFCYVIEDGVVVKRAVETGVASTSSIEIKTGLKAGDMVIIDLGDIQEGDKVEGVDPAELETDPMSDMMQMMNQ